MLHTGSTQGLVKIEYMIIYLDHAERNAKLSLRQAEILQQLNAAVSDSGQQSVLLAP
jgi:hypothetical protein